MSPLKVGGKCQDIIPTSQLEQHFFFIEPLCPQQFGHCEVRTEQCYRCNKIGHNNGQVRHCGKEMIMPEKKGMLIIYLFKSEFANETESEPN